MAIDLQRPQPTPEQFDETNSLLAELKHGNRLAIRIAIGALIAAVIAAIFAFNDRNWRSDQLGALSKLTSAVAESSEQQVRALNSLQSAQDRFSKSVMNATEIRDLAIKQDALNKQIAEIQQILKAMGTVKAVTPHRNDLRNLLNRRLGRTPSADSRPHSTYRYRLSDLPQLPNRLCAWSRLRANRSAV